MTDSITVFAPATVTNIACGFDVLGFALQNLGDIITIKPSPNKGLHIANIEGEQLPTDPKLNVATVAAKALLDSLSDQQQSLGFDLFIKKMVKPGSGLGSSASSAAAAVYGVNECLAHDGQYGYRGTDPLSHRLASFVRGVWAATRDSIRGGL